MSTCRFYGCCRHLAGPDPVFCDGKGLVSVESAVGTIHGSCRSYQPDADCRALLALADELELEGLDGWASGPLNVGEYARRIREACGGAS